MNELLPCPFCGRKNKLRYHYRRHHSYDNPLVAVKCDSCNIRGRYALNEDAALKVWNERAPLELETHFYLPKPEYALFGHSMADVEYDPDECRVKFTDRVDISVGAVMRYKQNRLNEEIVRRIVDVFRTECRRTEDGNCSECGRHLGRDAAFCKHCGARVTHSGQ